jgi:hypothetical protein
MMNRIFRSLAHVLFKMFTAGMRSAACDRAWLESPPFPAVIRNSQEKFCHTADRRVVGDYAHGIIKGWWPLLVSHLLLYGNNPRRFSTLPPMGVCRRCSGMRIRYSRIPPAKGT